jgi:hypothetical protein
MKFKKNAPNFSPIQFYRIGPEKYKLQFIEEQSFCSCNFDFQSKKQHFCYLAKGQFTCPIFERVLIVAIADLDS